MNKRIPVTVEMTEEGLPHFIAVLDESGKSLTMEVREAYLGDPIIESRTTFGESSSEIVEYSYKVRVRANNVLRTFKLFNDSNQKCWLLEV